MHILVVGAGAVGGYFGGRLLEAGRDVTFLVRARRAVELAESGLIIRSRYGDASLKPPTVLARDLHEHFDVVLLSCKAYDLEAAVADFTPAVGTSTALVPLLNGMRHLDLLDERLGRERVLGGQCKIVATLNEKREIEHRNEVHELSFGERDGGMSERVAGIASLLTDVKFDGRASADIVLEMWEKWVFLAALAAGTCLLRGTVGDIGEAAGGTQLLLDLLEECRLVSAREGYPAREKSLEYSRRVFTAKHSSVSASMLRDLESNGPIEADHVIGDLIERGNKHGMAIPLLKIAYAHLKTYESRRSRAMAAATTNSRASSSSRD